MNQCENRKLCCQIRKIEPLKRALQGMDAWITGIRKDQTLNRFQYTDGGMGRDIWYCENKSIVQMD